MLTKKMFFVLLFYCSRPSARVLCLLFLFPASILRFLSLSCSESLPAVSASCSYSALIPLSCSFSPTALVLGLLLPFRPSLRVPVFSLPYN